MSNLLDKKYGILDRLPSACRMRDRDTAGGRIDSKKKIKKKRKSHIDNHWEEVLNDYWK